MAISIRISKTAQRIADEYNTMGSVRPFAWQACSIEELMAAGIPEYAIKSQKAQDMAVDAQNEKPVIREHNKPLSEQFSTCSGGRYMAAGKCF